MGVNLPWYLKTGLTCVKYKGSKSVLVVMRLNMNVESIEPS